MNGISQPIWASIASPIYSSVSGSIAGGKAIVPPPDGFSYVPPVIVYEQAGVFSTSYNASNFMPATTADLWVSTSGNDTTGNGTQALPYASIKKALTQAALLADAGVHIHVLSGVYNNTNCWGGQSPAKDLVVTAEGGAVYSSTRINVTWTSVGSGVYSGTRASCFGIYDTTNLDAQGNPKLLTKVADQATCAATPNSWAQVSSTVYIHLFDGRVPTNASAIVLATVANGTQSVANNWYLKGITFEGGNASGPFYTPTAGAGGTLTFEDCAFPYNSGTTQGNGLSIFGCDQVVNVRTKAWANIADGLNYHVGQTNGVSPKFVEIDYLSYGNGAADGTNNDNASTCHDDCRGLRVNTIGFGCIGPQIADVGTSQTWNLGCSATASASTIPGDTSDSAFYTADTAEMWIDGCVGSSGYATVASSTSKIRTRNCTLTGLSSGDVSAY